MHSWFEAHASTATPLMFVALANFDTMHIFCSRILKRKRSIFDAPFTTKTIKELYFLGLVNNVFHDIPLTIVVVVCCVQLVKSLP